MRHWREQELSLFPSLKCVYSDCENLPVCRGFCRKHYDEMVKTNRLRKKVFASDKGCLIIGCGRKHNTKGYCDLHWKRYYQKQLKKDLMKVLEQDRCVRCGFTDIRALQFDHIHGDGFKDKRGSTRRMLDYILHPDEAREKLQLLCANCNWIKRAENNEVAGGG